MCDCGFTKENNWFRYRAGAIIIENDCVLFVGNQNEKIQSFSKFYKGISLFRALWNRTYNH